MTTELTISTVARSGDWKFQFSAILPEPVAETLAERMNWASIMAGGDEEAFVSLPMMAFDNATMDGVEMPQQYNDGMSLWHVRSDRETVEVAMPSFWESQRDDIVQLTDHDGKPNGWRVWAVTPDGANDVVTLWEAKAMIESIRQTLGMNIAWAD